MSLKNEEIPPTRFRDWWWHEFDSEGDAAEFDAGTLKNAKSLLPILRNLTWPDFEVGVDGQILRLKRICERHYRRFVIANNGKETHASVGD